MIDLDLLDLADAAYGPATIETESCHVLIREVEKTTVVAFRGTDPSSLVDLMRDADAVGFADPVLCSVADGFYGDVTSVAWRLIPKLSGMTMVVGHSKGGAEAMIFAAMLVYLGNPPARLTTFGAARPGTLMRLLSAIPGTDYRNAADPVPFLPPNFEPPRPMKQLGDFRLTLDPLGDHLLASYRSALTKLSEDVP